MMSARNRHVASFVLCAYLMQGQFLLWRNWGAATWKRYPKVPGADHSNGLLKVLSTARGCGVKETTLLWVWCWAVYRRNWQWYRITALLSGRSGWRLLWRRLFRLSLGFLSLRWFFRGQCDDPGAMRCTPYQGTLSGPVARFIDLTSMFLFFSDRHKMGHLLQQPIDNLWAQRLETKSLESQKGKLRASIN